MRRFASFLLFALLALPAFAQGAEPPADKASPMVALRLAMELGAGDVASVDDPKEWWHDTRIRDWRVHRLAEPGFVDTTHDFIVVYFVDRVPLLQWRVDTRAGTIARTDRPGCTFTTPEWCKSEAATP